MVGANGVRSIPDRYFSGILRFLFLAIVTLVLVASRSVAQPASKEHQVKAVFLFNFTQFIEWPESAFPNAETPFRIGILGEDVFGKGLDKLVEGETIQKHKLAVERSQKLEDLQNCQLIFISKSEKARAAEILSKLKGKPVLTVSELPGFASQGGMINFYLDGSKVRFEINPATSQRVGLKISSQLLSLGKIVESEPSSAGK